VMRGRGRVVDIQTKEDRGNQSTIRNPIPRRQNVAVWEDASNVRPRRYEIYGLCRTGSLGTLAFRRGHRSKRYRRLWSRRENPKLLAYFRQISWLFFQRDGPTARTCYAWVEIRSSRVPSACARLLRARSWSEESFQIIYQSCTSD
jgi:hypothetical protein